MKYKTVLASAAIFLFCLAGLNLAAGRSDVADAAMKGDKAAVRALLERKADVNAPQVDGAVALHWAVYKDDIDLADMLLRAGAKPDVVNREGITPLHMASLYGNVKMMDRLLKAGADPKRRGPAGETMLMLAARNGNPEAITLLIAAGVEGRFGGTDRTRVQVGQPAGAGQRGQRGVAQASPAKTPADDQGDQDFIYSGLVGTGGGGLTALVLASREGDLESAKLLLAAGADVNQTTEYGWTPLLTATNNRHYKLAEYLIEHGADVNKANKGAWTPLYLATDNRNIEGGDFPVPKPDLDHLEYIKFLLAHGANPNLRAKDNTLTRTIFTMQWFFEAGATPFVRAAQSGDLELLKVLLEHGADPMIPTDSGDTALSAAAGIGWVEGVTYEHSAKENVDVIKFLLDLVLDPNSSNQDGRTALMGAALKGRNEVVQLLVDHGAKLETRDRGSRDTDTVVSVNAGHTWQAVDYADGLVRTGVQSAVARPETAALLRKLMADRGLPFPPSNRTVDSICIVQLCKERLPATK